MRKKYTEKTFFTEKKFFFTEKNLCKEYVSHCTKNEVFH